MFRLVLTIVSSIILSGCLDTAELARTNSKTYWISNFRAKEMHVKMVDAVNILRVENSLSEIFLDEALNLAAKNHSEDMYRQDRAWHFGSDGSSPLERIARSGFEGELIGENISETFESDVLTLNAWMEEASARSIILHKSARFIGLGWYQAEDGKIWWTQILAE